MLSNVDRENRFMRMTTLLLCVVIIFFELSSKVYAKNIKDLC